MLDDRTINVVFRVLEPCEGKLSCTVLRGERESNLPDLLDRTLALPLPSNLKVHRTFLFQEHIRRFVKYQCSALYTRTPSAFV